MQNFNLVNYADMIRSHKIINSNDIDYVWSLHIPHTLSKDFKLYEVNELVPMNHDNPLQYEQFVHRKCQHPWIDVLTEWLNTSPGKHVYQFKFVNCRTDDTAFLYFTYTIQQDNPIQDYVYMRRESK